MGIIEVEPLDIFRSLLPSSADDGTESTVRARKTVLGQRQQRSPRRQSTESSVCARNCCERTTIGRGGSELFLIFSTSYEFPRSICFVIFELSFASQKAGVHPPKCAIYSFNGFSIRKLCFASAPFRYPRQQDNGEKLFQR